MHSANLSPPNAANPRFVIPKDAKNFQLQPHPAFPPSDIPVGDRFGDEEYLPDYPLPTKKVTRLVQETYETEMKEYDKVIARDAMTAFRKSQEKCREYRRWRTEMNRKIARSSKYFSLFPKSDDENAQEDKGSQVTVLPAMESPSVVLPFYVNTLHNVVSTEPYHGSFLPFPSRADFHFDEANAFHDLFPQGIHGLRWGWKKILPDWVLEKMEAKLSSRFPRISQLHETINYIFPNKLTVEAIPKRLAQMRGGPKESKASAQTFIFEMNERIRKFTCLFCGKMSCKEHASFGPMSALPYQPKFVITASISEPQPKPCGAQCFLKVKNVPKPAVQVEKSYHDYMKSYAANAKGSSISCKLAKICAKLRFPESLSCAQTNAYLEKYCTRNHVQAIEYLSKEEFEATQEHYTPIPHSTNLKAEFVSCACDKCNDNCPCHKGTGLCTRFCKCSVCANKFMGCTCVDQCDTSCVCKMTGFECDPEVCLNCHINDRANLNCCNAVIQIGIFRKLMVKPSTIPDSGMGCFTIEALKKGDFIGEYTGEIISQEETERRAFFTEKGGHSYIFSLNEKYNIDAMRIGSVLRFVNHLPTPNCFVKIVVVSAQQRIAFYAAQDIAAGEELFFNYNYNGIKGKVFNCLTV